MTRPRFPVPRRALAVALLAVVAVAVVVVAGTVIRVVRSEPTQTSVTAVAFGDLLAPQDYFAPHWVTVLRSGHSPPPA